MELAELVVAAQRGRTQSAVLRTFQKLASATRKWKLILPAAAVLAFVGWLGFRGKGPLSNSSKALPQPVSGAVASVVADEHSRVLAKPVRAPGIPAGYAKAGLPPGVVMASTTEKNRGESVIESTPQPEAASDSQAATIASQKLTSPAEKSPVDEMGTAPSMAVVSVGDNPVLAGILAPASTSPVQPLKISQGLSGGTIDWRVNPIYPPQARRIRLEGPVVLEAVVTEEGTVRDLKVINGNPLLGRAAMDAVARWHFQPFRLNGQPVQMTTNITLIFKLP